MYEEVARKLLTLNLPKEFIQWVKLTTCEKKMSPGDIDCIFDVYSEASKKALTETGKVAPFLFLFCNLPNTEHYFELMFPIVEFYENEHTKGLMGDYVGAMARTFNAYALITVAEAWAANFPQIPGETAQQAKARFEKHHMDRGSVENIDGRKEVILVVLETRAGGKQKMIDIDRDAEGKPSPGREVTDFTQAIGRFANMLKRTEN